MNSSLAMKRLGSGRKRTLALGAATIAAALLSVWGYPRPFTLVELKIMDLRMYGKRQLKPTGAVVIAAIDDRSIATLGRWPWPRNAEAMLLSALTDYQAAVIGLDQTMESPDTGQPFKMPGRDGLTSSSDSGKAGQLSVANDAILSSAISRHRRVYLGYAFSASGEGDSTSADATHASGPAPMTFRVIRQGSVKAPHIETAEVFRAPVSEIARSARGIAFVNIGTDADDLIRTATLAIDYGGRYCIPLSLALASAYMHDAPLGLSLSDYGVSEVSVGNLQIPVDQNGRMLIRFRGPSGTFPRFSVADIIQHRLPPEALAGKIVLVGATALGLGDHWATPLDDSTPGVEINANIIDNILRGDFTRRSKMTTAEELLAAVVLGFAVSIAVSELEALPAAAAALILAVGFLLYAYHRLVAGQVLLGVVFPIVTLGGTYTVLASYRYLGEGLEKRRMHGAFEHYMNPDVVAAVIDDPRGLRAGGELRHVAILFSDIVNFTGLAERTGPEALVALLNPYMSAMTDVILSGGGTVDKMMGDGIMAYWGAPRVLENAARSAIDSALKMLARLDELRASEPKLAELKVGIGVHVGEVLVGNIGGARRFDYSIIGDAVNFTSRLESLTRHFGVRLLASRAALDEAGGGYAAREIGSAKVKGKEYPVPIVEVMDRGSNHQAFEFCRRFSEAVSTARNGPTEIGIEPLRRLVDEQPDDRVGKLLLEKLQRHPGAELVFEFGSK